tara:strand:+ start:2086 stop:2835 length:750 start_codon:yes stop_codon:yes gene_type:complete
LIKALLLRRAWLIGNNLTTSVVILFLFPLSIFIFTNLALRKIPAIGLYDIEFDVWTYPSMIFLVAGLCILPSIFRDVFDLRVHKKVLSYLSLSPHSKRYMILSFSIVSIAESLIFGFVSIILFSALIPYPFGLIKTVGFILYFCIYVFLLSNVFITISILSDKLSTILISVFVFILFLLFGSGLIISLSYYPSSLENTLSALPLVMVIKAMQSYLFSGFINWVFTVIPLLTSLLLLSINSILIRNKLRQ